MMIISEALLIARDMIMNGKFDFDKSNELLGFIRG
jgi:hypothetical protein